MSNTATTRKNACAPGLYRKFEVRRCDGRDAPGKKHHGCRLFVLDIDHDPHAQPALKAYANSCRTQYPALSVDLINLLIGLETPAPRRVPGRGELLAEARDAEDACVGSVGAYRYLRALRKVVLGSAADLNESDDALMALVSATPEQRSRAAALAAKITARL